MITDEKTPANALSPDLAPRCASTKPATLSQVLCSTLKRDCLVHYRHAGDILIPVLFFCIMLLLFPLAITPDPQLLQTLAPGLIWISALLATLLSLPYLFQRDFDEGHLEQLLISPWPLSLLVLTKVFAYWLGYCLPLILLAPVLAIGLHLPSTLIPTLLISLLLGTPTLCLIGGIGSALTLKQHNGGLIISLLIVPLALPVLIFGSHCLILAAHHAPISSLLLILAALLCLSLSLAPLAIAAALRISCY